MENKKLMKLEFVINITEGNAVFLWNLIVSLLQNIGFDCTGNVREVAKIEIQEE